MMKRFFEQMDIHLLISSESPHRPFQKLSLEIAAGRCVRSLNNQPFFSVFSVPLWLAFLVDPSKKPAI
jgi:hypothetical protein